MTPNQIITCRTKEGLLYTGKLLTSLPFDHANTFRMTVEPGPLRTAGFYQRVIDRSKLIEYQGKALRVTRVPKFPEPIEEESWQVEASSAKGFYTVQLIRGLWSCTCRGFQFRHFCKHIKAKQEEKLG